MIELGLADGFSPEWLPYLNSGLIGMLGGLANYFYYIDKKHLPFRVGALLTTAVLAFFIGIAGHSLLPESPNKPGYLIIAGFFCYRIIETVEINAHKLIKIARSYQERE